MATVGLDVFIVDWIIAVNRHVSACNGLHQNLFDGLGILLYDSVKDGVKVHTVVFQHVKLSKC